MAYVAADSPEAAARLLVQILEAASSLGTLSERGRVVPERADPAIRETLIDPFRLVYEVLESEVSVLGIIHQRRHFQARVEQERKRRDAP